MSAASLHRLRNPWKIKILGTSFILLCACEITLLADFLTEYFEIEDSIFSRHHTLIEGIALISLTVTLFIIGFDFWRLIKENREFRSVLGMASGEFLYILSSKFHDWKLSDSEREIALLLIKGLSIQEIADIRETKPGTIKSQCSSIYRKANVKGRNELVAYFVEDLLAGDTLTDTAEPQSPVTRPGAEPTAA